MRRGKFVLNSEKIDTLELQGSDGRKWAVVPSFSYVFFLFESLHVSLLKRTQHNGS